MVWNRSVASRWGMRPLGMVSLLLASAAGRHLIAIAPRYPQAEPPLVYALALVAFVCGSAGCALLVHGHHLFDRVEVAERWRPSHAGRIRGQAGGRATARPPARAPRARRSRRPSPA